MQACGRTTGGRPVILVFERPVGVLFVHCQIKLVMEIESKEVLS